MTRRYLFPKRTQIPKDPKRAQSLNGALLWVSTRTHPEISFAVSKACSAQLKSHCAALSMSKKTLRFLQTVKDQELSFEPWQESSYSVLPNHPSIQGAAERRGLKLKSGSCDGIKRLLIQIHADASFAPQGTHSVSGVCIDVGSSPVHWRSVKQLLMTLSSAEAELVAQSLGLQLGLSVASTYEAMGIPTRLNLACDNQAALSIRGGSSTWRTRHLLMRATDLTEAWLSGSDRVVATWVATGQQKADVFTKHLSRVLMGRACQLMSMQSQSRPSIAALQLSNRDRSRRKNGQPVVLRCPQSHEHLLSSTFKHHICRGAITDPVVEETMRVSAKVLQVDASTLFEKAALSAFSQIVDRVMKCPPCVVDATPVVVTEASYSPLALSAAAVIGAGVSYVAQKVVKSCKRRFRPPSSPADAVSS